MPDLRMHVVGEIQRGRARGQVDDFPFRRQRIDAVFGEFALEAALHALGAGLEQLPHPFDPARQRGVVAGAAFLVAPVRGHAEFGLAVHLAGADLHFDGFPLRTEHRGVQRTVIVALGPGDVVVEFARHRHPQRMHHAERGVAGGHVLDQHAQRTQVVELADRHVLLLHLPPDAVDVLRPPGDFGGHAVRGQRVREFAAHFGDVAFAAAAVVVEQARDALVGLGFQRAKREVLQFPLQLPDAEPVGQRCVQVAGEPRHRLALRGIQIVHPSHPRQLPREQDRHHAQVLDHRQQQPAQAFLVACRTGLGVQRPNLRRGVLSFQQRRHARMRAQDRVALRRRRGFAERVQRGGEQRVLVAAQRAQGFQRIAEHGRILRGQARGFGQQGRQRPDGGYGFRGGSVHAGISGEAGMATLPTHPAEGHPA